MATSKLSAPHFHDEEAAFAFLEARIWPNGPVCPHCGGEGYALQGVRGKSKTDDKGNVIPGAVRIGLKKCRACRKQFTVRKGTVFEDSPVPLHIWLQAVALVAASKKGISANQLHRTLGVTLKTAWFMGHRIREMMTGKPGKFGGGGGGVEIDETFIGRDPAKPIGMGYEHKFKVFALVDRTTGQARSMVVDNLNKATLLPLIREHVERDTRVITDQAGYYRLVGREFDKHETVNHERDEYVRGDVHTNTIEGYFSIFKRGMRGTYQHCSKAHLHRYLAEFDFRYTHRIARGVDDQARFGLMLDGAVGKRLTWKAADCSGTPA